MKYSHNIKEKALLIMLLLCIANWSIAQSLDCNFKEPILNIGFGAIGKMQPIKFSTASNYNNIYGTCPDDGQYSFVTYTTNCFSGHWHTYREDHTPGDASGMMLVINASKEKGSFFILPVANLKKNTTYQFAVWLSNVCKIGQDCTATPPVISISIETATGKQLTVLNTGEIEQKENPEWQRYYGNFTTEAEENIVIKMNDITDGGCGNDFAMDDITIKECMIQKTLPIETPKPVQKPVVITPTIPNKTITVPKPIISKPIAKSNPAIRKTVLLQKPDNIQEVIKPKPIKIAIPKILIDRENPIVKKIESATTELTIDLYDNGEIDGDTVSIYHNNILVVARQGISEKPISFKIKIDKENPHHEIVMVANNVGTIPPNTSLMIVTAKDKRYEVFISSSEQKNAKILIDLKD
jgi:hypothetical protein